MYVIDKPYVGRTRLLLRTNGLPRGPGLRFTNLDSALAHADPIPGSVVWELDPDTLFPVAKLTRPGGWTRFPLARKEPPPATRKDSPLA